VKISFMGIERQESGQVVIFLAIAMAAVVAIGALAVDVGWMRLEKRKLQTIADNAAIEAAGEMRYDAGHTSGYVPGTGAAVNLASQMGFVDGVNGATLAVNCPPSTGPHAGSGTCTNQTYVEVIATQTASTFFAKVFGVKTATISARAVAWTGATGGCVYALNPSATQTFLVSGSGTFKANCGIIDDSNNSTAFVCSGGATVTSTQTGVVGGKSLTGGCTATPIPVTGISYVSDPLAYLMPPTASCPTAPPPHPTGCSYSANGGLVCNSAPKSGEHIQHGTYCGGITISAAAGGETFDSGTYVLAGGRGLNVSGSATITGSGVTFYHTTDPSGTASFNSIALSGSSSSSLTAPTTGSYAGILIYEDRQLA
jgi:hypothetical protein